MAAAAVVTRVTDEVVAGLSADGDVLVAEAAERGVFLDPGAGIAWVYLHQPPVLLADLAERNAIDWACWAQGSDTVHTYVQDDTARKLVDDCRQVFGSDPVFVSEIGPVIGAHIGPGLLGFGGLPRELLGDAGSG